MRRWFEEVWNQGIESSIDELLAPEVIGHGILKPDGKEVDSAAAFKEYYRRLRSGLSEIHVLVEDTVTEGDLTVARCTVTARHTGDGLGFAATNKPVKFTGLAMARIRDGQIVESWNEFDFRTMFLQLGA